MVPHLLEGVRVGAEVCGQLAGPQVPRVQNDHPARRRRGPCHEAVRVSVGADSKLPEIDTSGEEDKAFENKDDLEQLDSCLSLVDTIGESNIVFVGAPKALRSCAQYLMKQPVVGFDAEWKAIRVCAEPNNPTAPCALIQLASRDKAFVVDMVELVATTTSWLLCSSRTKC